MVIVLHNCPDRGTRGLDSQILDIDLPRELLLSERCFVFSPQSAWTVDAMQRILLVQQSYLAADQTAFRFTPVE